MSTEQGGLEQATNDVNTVDSSVTEIVSNSTNDVNTQTAEPSTEVTTDVKPLNVFEAVKAGLAEAKAEETANASSGVEEVAKVDATDETKEVEANSDEDLIKSLDPKSRASTRIRELISENKTLTSNAQNFEALSNWTRQSGLDQQEFVTGLEIMKAMKNDPAKAWEMLQPHLTGLQEFIGLKLPDDIQAKVDTGLIDEETAQELVANRNRAELLSSREQEGRQQTELQQQMQAQTAHVKAIADGVTTWEKNWEKTDPDYSKKKALVKATVTQLLTEEGVPATPQAAVAQAQRAREIVENNLKGILPARQSVKTIVGGSSSTVAQVPKSSLDAAKAALAGQQVNY